MDIQTYAAAITIAAILILAVFRMRKHLSAKKEKRQKRQVHDARPGNRQQSGKENKLQEGQTEEAGGNERTMLLTYTTLILKDTRHPVKKYKADLFCPVMIGRSKENTIVLDDSSVSRKHLRVFRIGALVYAENLSQMNGTLLNGKQLTGTKEIVTGSRLEIGKQSFLVEID